MTRIRWQTGSKRALGDERGLVTAMFAVLAIFLFAIVSMVAEGGRKLSNVSRAEDIAAEAARSAAATLSVEEIANGVAVIDQTDGRARLSADTIVNTVDGAQIESFIVDADRVRVVVRVTGTSWIPGFDIDGVGSHTAVALDPFGGSP